MGFDRNKHKKIWGGFGVFREMVGNLEVLNIQRVIHGGGKGGV